MRRVSNACLAVLGGVVLALCVPAHAQTNNNDYTPLGSRIRRDRPFPTEPQASFSTAQMSKVNRDRSKAMLNQLGKCLYKRSNEAALDLLNKTDFGFADFQQIKLDPERATKVYGFRDCLSELTFSQNSGVSIRFTAGGLRQLLLQEAYFNRFPERPTWLKPGNVIEERTYPLSEANPTVRWTMDLADCVVQADPYSADYFYRAPSGSEEEQSALAKLTPSLGPCLPQGQQVKLSVPALRIWLGEGLWHAANHNVRPVVPAAGGGQ